mmetsp:Transcript_6562/g.7510  ORF Transcript_6562/g.7510 Transcript_6562/m.7510 type:complete len:258 (+) Transcript_6562:2285-3058(+)
MRCGRDSYDARSKCGKTCQIAGHWGECDGSDRCYTVQPNYCGSKPDPDPTCNNYKSDFRCGVDEFHARESCGETCNPHDPQSCSNWPAETCHQTEYNYCHCLGNSFTDETLCNHKQVEYVSRTYAKSQTTFKYRVTDTDSNSNNRPKDITIGWTGTCCVEDANYFHNSERKKSAGENIDTCTQGIKFTKKWSSGQTEPEEFTLVMSGDVPAEENASLVSVNTVADKFCLYQLKGPSCDCEPSDIVFESSSHITGGLL